MKGSQQMSSVFESVVEEIFNRFDTNQNGILTYPQCKALWELFDRNLEHKQFENFLITYVSTKFSKFRPTKSTLPLDD